MAITPFQIAVPSAELDDLRARLARTRWPDQLEGAGWDYGTDLHYLAELCRYWEREFDWRKQEAALNSFHQFRAQIGGLGLHFIHERAPGPGALPLLLTHGYPDSFARFRKLIPLLTRPAPGGEAFDVVVPSLPGYGFSDRPRDRGMTPDRIAGLFLELMTELGYDRFVAHGGDWGGMVSDALARLAPERVLARHQTDLPWRLLFSVKPEELTEPERRFLAAGKRWQKTEGAYGMIQGTRPQTLAYAMNDSPAGLAGWIVEKFRAWSDCGGDVERRFTRDELLTHITIYWVTQTAGSAFRIYYETAANKAPAPPARQRVPIGLAIFPHEIVPVPREFAERFYDVRRWTTMPRGGHFAAMEEPELLAEDLRALFFGDLGLGSIPR
jgi:pimeloyl-ACP methyl ester carboxylesterase